MYTVQDSKRERSKEKKTVGRRNKMAMKLLHQTARKGKWKGGKRVMLIVCGKGKKGGGKSKIKRQAILEERGKTARG